MVGVLTFDTETTGLPLRRSFPGIPAYADLEAFKSCRMVSISWICEAPDRPIYYIVKPDGFLSTPASIAIHGITHEKAMEVGVPFDDIMAHFFSDLRRANVGRIVAHNLEFDMNVLRSELLRRGMEERLIELGRLQQFCTMLEGQRRMGVRKWPKLAELYKYLTQEEITNAHNALYDTMHCHRCYMILSATTTTPALLPKIESV
jgi:DNA polymerase III epsilon subunit-like protein